MREGFASIVLVMALVAVPVAVAVLPEEPVLTGPRNDTDAAADWSGADEVLVWARSRPGDPGRYDAWAREGADAPIKLNVGGQGYGGGVDYPQVVYQRARSGQSNIYLYDLSDDTRPDTPAGVNTPKWEYLPSISGDWLLFGRADNGSPTERIVLHNGDTHDERVLAVVTRRSHSLWPGQVNGNWAAYTRCPGPPSEPVCNVILYDIAAETKTPLAKPATREQYSASVTSAGVVYLVRARTRCGTSVRIVRYGPSDPSTGTVLAALPQGRDAGFGSVRENPDGSVDFFYGRFTCASGRYDLYKVSDPPPGP